MLALTRTDSVESINTCFVTACFLERFWPVNISFQHVLTLVMYRLEGGEERERWAQIISIIIIILLLLFYNDYYDYSFNKCTVDSGCKALTEAFRG